MPVVISKRTRQVLREYFVGTSLRIIEMTFDAANIEADLQYESAETGQRRTLVEQYYHTLDWTSTTDVGKFLSVADSVMAELEAMVHQAPTNGEYANSERFRIQAAFARDGFEYVDGRFMPKGSASHFAEIAASAAKLDAPELHRQLERMRASRSPIQP